MCVGILHLVVPGRLQLRHHEEDPCTEPQHWRARLHGSALCRQGKKLTPQSPPPSFRGIFVKGQTDEKLNFGR